MVSVKWWNQKRKDMRLLAQVQKTILKRKIVRRYQKIKTLYAPMYLQISTFTYFVTYNEL